MARYVPATATGSESASCSSASCSQNNTTVLSGGFPAITREVTITVNGSTSASASSDGIGDAGGGGGSVQYFDGASWQTFSGSASTASSVNGNPASPQTQNGPWTATVTVNLAKLDIRCQANANSTNSASGDGSSSVTDWYLDGPGPVYGIIST